MEQLVAQGIGFIGMLVIVAMYQVNRRSFTLRLLILSSVLFIIHFFLLGALTAVAMNVIGAFRAFVFDQRDRKKKLNRNATMYVFVALFCTAGLLFWNGPISLLPMAAMTVECFALWSAKTKRIRWLMLAARPGWFSYNFLVGSYAGVATEVFLVTTLLVSIYRFDFRKSGKNSVP